MKEAFRTFTTTEVALIARVDRRTVVKWIDEGTLVGARMVGFRQSAYRRVADRDLEVFLLAHDLADRVALIRRVRSGERLRDVIADVDEVPLERPTEPAGWTPTRDARAESEDDSGYVYFFQLRKGGPIKIGFTSQPRERFRQLCYTLPDGSELICLGLMLGGRPHEFRLHQQFRAIRVNREWFRPDPSLLEYIARKTISMDAMLDEV